MSNRQLNHKKLLKTVALKAYLLHQMQIKFNEELKFLWFLNQLAERFSFAHSGYRSETGFNTSSL